MPLPTTASKRFMYCGAKKGTTWGTAVAVGAGSKLFVDDDGKPDFKQPYVQNDQLGYYTPYAGRLGQMGPIDFSIETDGFLYDHGAFTSLIAGVFGTTDEPAKDENNAYTHTFTWADLASYFFTYCTLRPGHLWEIPSIMPYKVTFKVKSGVLSAAIAVRGQSMTDNSSVNNNTTMEAMTCPDTIHEVRLGECVVRLAAEAGAAFNNTTDAITVSDLEVVLERTIDSVFASAAEGIMLPRDKAPKWTAKLTLPRTSDADKDITEYLSLTPYRMDITGTGIHCVGAIHYSWRLAFPRLVLTDAPKKPLADIMTTVYEFVGEQSANNAEADMSNNTRPFMVLVNMNSASYLA